MIEDHARAVLADAQRDELLTVKAYAELVGCHFQSVYRAISKQRFPHPVLRPLGGAIEIHVPADVLVKYRALKRSA